MYPSKETPSYLIKLHERYDYVFIKNSMQILDILFNEYGFKYIKTSEIHPNSIQVDFIDNTYKVILDLMFYDKVFNFVTLHNMKEVAKFIDEFPDKILKYKLNILVDENIC